MFEKNKPIINATITIIKNGTTFILKYKCFTNAITIIITGTTTRSTNTLIETYETISPALVILVLLGFPQPFQDLFHKYSELHRQLNYRASDVRGFAS